MTPPPQGKQLLQTVDWTNSRSENYQNYNINMCNLVCFFFKVDDQCIKVTSIQNLDKYVAQCYGKNQMINIFYNELNRFSFQQNKLLTSY